MPSVRKRSEGCWTCRLRRKRCDLIRPVCRSCSSLQITCFFDDQKPAWMDGAAEQKQMMQNVTSEIKQNALQRRERRNMGSQEREIVVTIERKYQNSPAFGSPLSSSVTANTQVREEDSITSPVTILPSIPTLTATTSSSEGSIESNKLPRMQIADDCILPLASTHFSYPSESPSKDSGVVLSSDNGVELGAIMTYLDYVFPFLFPFYHPPLLQTGRHWLLSHLCLNEASFHTAASLSYYFFTTAANNSQQELDESCKAVVLTQLLEQMDLAIQKTQQDIHDITYHGIQSTLVESAHVLGEIIQLLVVEVTVRRTVEWTIHLSPALILFEEIFKYHGTSSSQPNLDALLSQMPPPFMAMEMGHSKPVPNTADQSALLFHISILLFIDIVASTSLNQPSRLRQYHINLLTNSNGGKIPIQLENFIGCQNWALLTISDISALNTWKKTAKSDGTMSVIDLVNRAQSISHVLENGLASLNSADAKDSTHLNTDNGLRSYYSRLEGKSTDYDSIKISTRIWAYAASIYLSITLSGWQPAHPDVQDSVVKILALLRGIESPAQLRSLSWPLCVAGCLALPHQEQEFRSRFDDIGELRIFGTLCQAQDIMEEVWKSRDTINPDTWDINTCLNILGSPALLV